MNEIEDYIKDDEYFEVSELLKQKISKDDIYKYIKEYECQRIAPGMYAKKGVWVDELLVLHKRCPQGVISHDEALYHYGLVDREPMVHTITIYSGYNSKRLKNSGYKTFYVNKDLLELGKTMVTDHFGNDVPMYDMDRTIVDMVRNRSKFEAQDFICALKNYAISNDKDLNNLYLYAKKFKVDKIIQNYMGVLL